MCFEVGPEEPHHHPLSALLAAYLVPLALLAVEIPHSRLVGVIGEADADASRQADHRLCLRSGGLETHAVKVGAQGVESPLEDEAEAESIISKQDIDVLGRAVGPAEDREYKTGVKSKSISPPVNTVAKQTSVLDANRYGLGNRPQWALSRTRFPNLIKALNTVANRNTHKWVSSSYHGLII